MTIRQEMAENLVFKGKQVWFLMLQSVRKALVNIHTQFEVSRCLICPTIQINICSIQLITGIFPQHNQKNKSTLNAIYSPPRPGWTRTATLKNYRAQTFRKSVLKTHTGRQLNQQKTLILRTGNLEKCNSKGNNFKPL